MSVPAQPNGFPKPVERAFHFSHFPWITALLVLANLAAYAFTSRRGPMEIDEMVRFGGKVGPLIADLGEAWRLLTANFLHRGALHVGLNMVVLLAVGAVLENAYRSLDYLWLLLISGLSTMAVSFFLSDAVSVGASGIVYGCLGAAFMFGLRHRAMLPARYRRVLGEAAILVILIFLWIGLMSAGTDNAAHFGGLLSGMAAGLPLQARSAIGDERGWRRVLQTGSLVLILGTIAAAPLGAGRLLPRFRTERDRRLGLSVLIPTGWKRTTRGSNQLAFYNGLPSFGRAGFAVDVLTDGSEADAGRRLRRLLEKELQPELLGPQVLKASVGGPTAALVDQNAGILVPATVEETFGRTRVRAYFVKRGEVTYQLVFSYPSAFPRYGGVIDAMVAGIRFEPK